MRNGASFGGKIVGGVCKWEFDAEVEVAVMVER
jgi:hypothetical protein